MNPPEPEPAPPDSPEDDTVDGRAGGVVLSAASLLDAIRKLEEKVDARLAYDATKEQAFEYLYGDLRDAKLSASLEATRPLLLDLVLLYDRLVAAARESEAVTLLQSFRDEVLEILYRRDVHPIRPTRERFDPDIQQVVGTIEAAEPDEDQLVDRVVREGFRWGTRVLRPQDVVMRRMRRPPQAGGDDREVAVERGEKGQ